MLCMPPRTQEKPRAPRFTVKLFSAGERSPRHIGQGAQRRQTHPPQYQHGRRGGITAPGCAQVSASDQSQAQSQGKRAVMLSSQLDADEDLIPFA